MKEETRKRKNSGRLKFSVFFVVVFSVLCNLSSVFSEGELNRKEEDAFYVAAKAYQDGFYDLSLVLFDRFLNTYMDSRKRAEAMIYVGQNYFKQEKYLKALDQFDALNKIPEASAYRDRILYWLAEIHGKGKDYRQASEYLQELIDNCRDSFYYRQAHTLLAQAQMNEGKFKDSQATYKLMLERFRDKSTQEEAFFGICENYYLLRDFPSLKNSINDFLSKFPSSKLSGRAYFYLGEACYYLERYEEAITAYQKCLRSAYAADQTIPAQIGIGWSYLRLKRYEDADRLFSQFAEQEQPLGIILGKAVTCSGLGKYKEALALYEKVIALDANGEYSPLAYFGKGETLYNLGLFEGSISAYKISLDKLRLLSRWLGEPRELRDKILYGLAWAYLRVGDFQAAQQEFQKVASSSADKIFKLSALCQLGDVYQDSGEYDRAIETYNSILKDYPDSIYNDYIQYQIGITWLKSDKLDQAVVALRKLIKEFPDSKLIDDANYFLGVIYFQKGDFVSARSQLELFMSSFKDSSFRHQAIFLLGEALLNLEEFKGAIEAFGLLVRDQTIADSLRQKAEYEMASSYSQMGQQNEAKRRLSDFVTRFPDSPLTPNIILELGGYCMESGDPQQARKYYERLIRNYPGNEFVGDAYIAIGESFLSEGNNTDALKSFMQARENGRLESAAHALLLAGDVCLKQKDLEKARKYYEESLSMQTSWVKSANIRLARLMKEEKRYSQAVAMLEKASQVQGPDKESDVQFMIAEIWEEAGEPDRAVESYLKVHYLFPQEKELSAKALLRAARIYEGREDWIQASKMLEKVASLDVAEAKYAGERLAEIQDNQKQKMLAGRRAGQ